MNRQKAAHERELERRRHLENSCKPAKIRTYACNEEGNRTIKYFSYHYDFEEDKCVEKIKKVVQKCEAIREENDEHDHSDSDGRDLDEERSFTRRRVQPIKHHGKMTKADDYNDKTLGVH